MAWGCLCGCPVLWCCVQEALPGPRQPHQETTRTKVLVPRGPQLEHCTPVRAQPQGSPQSSFPLVEAHCPSVFPYPL